MAYYLTQRRWGRACLHLAVAVRGGHWRWHLGFIRREMPLVPRLPAPAGRR